MLDMSKPEAQEQLRKIQEQQSRGIAAMKRIAPEDAKELTAMRLKGAETKELAKFYAEARDKEARRVGSLMTDEEKLKFAQFCSQPGISEGDIDLAFDEIRREVDRRLAATLTTPTIPLHAPLSFENQRDELKDDGQGGGGGDRVEVPEERPRRHRDGQTDTTGGGGGAPFETREPPPGGPTEDSSNSDDDPTTPTAATLLLASSVVGLTGMALFLLMRRR